MKTWYKQHGLTMLEAMAVVAMLAVALIILARALQNQSDARTRESAVATMAREMRILDTAARRFLSDNPDFPQSTATTAISIEGHLIPGGYLPDTFAERTNSAGAIQQGVSPLGTTYAVITRLIGEGSEEIGIEEPDDPIARTLVIESGTARRDAMNRIGIGVGPGRLLAFKEEIATTLRDQERALSAIVDAGSTALRAVTGTFTMDLDEMLQVQDEPRVAVMIGFPELEQPENVGIPVNPNDPTRFERCVFRTPVYDYWNPLDTQCAAPYTEEVTVIRTCQLVYQPHGQPTILPQSYGTIIRGVETREQTSWSGVHYTTDRWNVEIVRLHGIPLAETNCNWYGETNNPSYCHGIGAGSAPCTYCNCSQHLPTYNYGLNYRVCCEPRQ